MSIQHTNRSIVRRLMPFYLLTFLLFSCTNDSYEKGEGKYSLIQADFAELTINSEKYGISFLTDEGDEYRLNKPLTASWIETADTIYVFEFKLDGTAEEALKQIQEKGYAIPYEAGDKKVIKIGANFDKELRTIERWVVA